MLHLGKRLKCSGGFSREWRAENTRASSWSLNARVLREGKEAKY